MGKAKVRESLLKKQKPKKSLFKDLSESLLRVSWESTRKIKELASQTWSPAPLNPTEIYLWNLSGKPIASYEDIGVK